VTPVIACEDLFEPAPRRCGNIVAEQEPLALTHQFLQTFGVDRRVVGGFAGAECASDTICLNACSAGP
jgi:hypothetical protein